MRKFKEEKENFYMGLNGITSNRTYLFHEIAKKSNTGTHI